MPGKASKASPQLSRAKTFTEHMVLSSHSSSNSWLEGWRFGFRIRKPLLIVKVNDNEADC